MPAVRHLNHAPIIEAIIGIELSDILPKDVLTAFSHQPEPLQKAYPVKQDIMSGQFTFDLVGNNASTSQEPIGFFFRSEDGLQVFHAKRNGFAFSRLHPYQTWERFRDEALNLWTFYRHCAGPATASTFTVRYINKLFLPIGTDVEDSLQLYAEVPESLPKMQNSLIRIQFSLPEQKGIAIVQQMRLPNEKPEFATLLFDNEFRIPCLGLDDEEIWRQIESVRDIKNKFFFDALTEDFVKTLE